MKNNYQAIAITIIVLVGGIFIISQLARQKLIVEKTPPPNPTQIAQSSPTPPTFVLGTQTKNTNCSIENSLPDKACTPGAVIQNVSKDDICTPGYAKSARNVPQSEKDQVNLEYGLPTKHAPGEYEIDHLISLELGGSNDISNLWPEAAEPRPGFHEKDKVENYLHDQICSGQISVEQAQQMISNNWLDVYNQIK